MSPASTSVTAAFVALTMSMAGWRTLRLPISSNEAVLGVDTHSQKIPYMHDLAQTDTDTMKIDATACLHTPVSMLDVLQSEEMDSSILYYGTQKQANASGTSTVVDLASLNFTWIAPLFAMLELLVLPLACKACCGKRCSKTVSSGTASCPNEVDAVFHDQIVDVGDKAVFTNDAEDTDVIIHSLQHVRMEPAEQENACLTLRLDANDSRNDTVEIFDVATPRSAEGDSISDQASIGDNLNAHANTNERDNAI